MKKSKFSEEQIACVLARWCGVGHRLRIALHCGGRGCPMNLRCFAFGVASFLFLQATSVAQQEMFYDSGGVRIRYLEAGKGLPVVLVHGQGSSADGNEWGKSGVFSALAKEYRVIAFDMRGHGKSAKPRDPKLYGPEMGMDIVRLLDHLRIQKADVVGYSLGTMVVATALASHPERSKRPDSVLRKKPGGPAGSSDGLDQ
jgi:predicted alpha/beta-fold hydrolase